MSYVYVENLSCYSSLELLNAEMNEREKWYKLCEIGWNDIVAFVLHSFNIAHTYRLYHLFLRLIFSSQTALTTLRSFKLHFPTNFRQKWILKDDVTDKLIKVWCNPLVTSHYFDCQRILNSLGLYVDSLIVNLMLNENFSVRIQMAHFLNALRQIHFMRFYSFFNEQLNNVCESYEDLEIKRETSKSILANNKVNRKSQTESQSHQIIAVCVIFEHGLCRTKWARHSHTNQHKIAICKVWKLVHQFFGPNQRV